MGRLYKKSQSLSRGLTSDTTSAILWFYGKKERCYAKNLRNLGRFLLDRHISLIYNSRSERNGSSHTERTDSERVRKKGKVMETDNKKERIILIDKTELATYLRDKGYLNIPEFTWNEESLRRKHEFDVNRIDWWCPEGYVSEDDWVYTFRCEMDVPVHDYDKDVIPVIAKDVDMIVGQVYPAELHLLIGKYTERTKDSDTVVTDKVVIPVQFRWKEE